MLRDTAVDIIMQRLGNRKDTDLRDDIINEMVFVQESILEGGPFYPWFLVTEESYIDTTPGDERVAVPSDFLHEWEDSVLYRFDATATGAQNPWIPLERDDWDTIRQELTTVDGGVPTKYDISGDYFMLADTPDDAYSVRMRYFAADESLAGTYGDAANIENKWLKHAPDWFIGEVGLIIGNQYLQSDVMDKVFGLQLQRGRKRVYDKDVSMAESNKMRSMGDD